MINNELDVDFWKAQLAKRSHAQIPDLLKADEAERLRNCLAREVSWRIAERSDNAESRTHGCERWLLAC